MACESVATAAGDDAQRRVGVDEGACYFVDRAVASYCYDNVDALACSLAGDDFGMTGVLRVAHAVGVLARVNTAPDALADVYLSVCAGFGIDDEEYGLHRNVGGIKRLRERSGGVRACGVEVFLENTNRRSRKSIARMCDGGVFFLENTNRRSSKSLRAARCFVNCY